VDGDASHTALVAAVAARDGDEAARLLEAEFAAPPARPRG
jgi:DNA-binding GntR family transcriptional regulator